MSKKRDNLEKCVYASRRTLHNEERWDVIDTSVGSCRLADCMTCGWNPGEHERRVKKIMAGDWAVKMMDVIDAAGNIVETIPVKYLDVSKGESI